MTAAATPTIHDRRFPGESGEYRAARDRLLAAEMELRRQTEAVAAQRRALPPGGVIPEDYLFEEGEASTPVRMSALFGDKDVLVIYNFMYGPAMKAPCPSCSSILDALDGQAVHIERKVALAVVARSPMARILAFTGPRGWQHMRLLSSANNSFNPDYFGESETGSQRPMINVFTRSPSGEIRHSWASELAFAPSDPGQDPRHADFMWPLWGVLDISPQGRGDFRPGLTY